MTECALKDEVTHGRRRFLPERCKKWPKTTLRIFQKWPTIRNRDTHIRREGYSHLLSLQGEQYMGLKPTQGSVLNVLNCECILRSFVIYDTNRVLFI